MPHDRPSAAEGWIPTCVLSAFVLLLGTGCQPDVHPARGPDSLVAPGAPPPGAGLAFGLDPAGRSPPLPLPPPPAADATLILHLTLPPDRCAQIWELRDSRAQLIGPPRTRDDLGPYCVSCAQRASVLRGEGLYVLPSGEGPFAPAEGLTVQLAARDCQTLLHTPAAPGERWSLGARWAPPPPAAAAALDLDFFVTPGSALFADPAAAETLSSVLPVAQASLAPGRAQLRLGRVVPLAAPDPVRISALAADLPAALAAARDPDRVPVVLAGCLQQLDPPLPQVAEPAGLVLRVPGGPAGADVILLRGRGCLPRSTPDPVRPDVLAQLLSHELGHYLGLYHTVEADGREDGLADTGPDNLMNPDPLAPRSAGLTAGQLAVLLRHPLWRRPLPSPSDRGEP